MQDDEIHFDHIIPWSKGGPTEEHNIRLLCGDCNRKKGATFEGEYLVEDFHEHAAAPVGREFREMLLWLVSSAHEWRRKKKRLPTPKDLRTLLRRRKVTEVEESLSQVVHDLDAFFAGPTPEELESELFEALRDRWGFPGGGIRKLKDAATDRGLSVEDLFVAEKSLIARLGWRISLTRAEEERWLRS